MSHDCSEVIQNWSKVSQELSKVNHDSSGMIQDSSGMSPDKSNYIENHMNENIIDLVKKTIMFIIIVSYI